MRVANRRGGPTQPGDYPLVDVTYEEGTGGPIRREFKQIVVRSEGGLMFLFPTHPDAPDVEWALLVSRIVRIDYVATVSFALGDLS